MIYLHDRKRIISAGETQNGRGVFFASGALAATTGDFTLIGNIGNPISDGIGVGRR